MALTYAVIKKTNQEAVVKFWGTDDNVTVTLASDLLAATQEVTGTPSANIVTMAWTGLVGSTIKIERGTNLITFVSGEGSDELDFNGLGFNDNISSESDIKVTVAGTAQLYLVVRKTAGYSTKVEPATYGQYDDPTQVGA